jgi:hypothetical protein
VESVTKLAVGSGGPVAKTVGGHLATARRHLRAPAGAVDDIDLQLLEFGDALIYALVPYPGHRRPVFLQQRESVRQGGELRGDFLEAEAGALPDRNIADLQKGRFTVAAMLALAAHTQPNGVQDLNFLRVNQKNYAAVLKGCSTHVHHRFAGDHALGGERKHHSLAKW